MDYQKREDSKAEGWRLYHEHPTNVYQRARGIIQVIDAHYWRAREHLEQLPQPKVKLRKIMPQGARGSDLDIDLYTEHWLYANGDSLDPAVLQEIARIWHYNPVESRYLPKGHTSYVFE